jgi:hypothetical protein
MNHHCLDAQFAAGPLNSQGDFAAVGDQNLLKEWHGLA